MVMLDFYEEVTAKDVLVPKLSWETNVYINNFQKNLFFFYLSQLSVATDALSLVYL